MHWQYERPLPPHVPDDAIDPRCEGRHGRVLSQKAYNLVRKKQLKLCLKHGNEHNLSMLLTPDEYPELEWPVIIGQNHEAIALLNHKALGQGAYGRVYIGISLDTGQPVSVKLQCVSRDEQYTQEAVNECKSLKKQNKLIDKLLFEEGYDVYLYLIQPYVFGEELASVLYESDGTKKEISLAEKFKIALSAANALAEFHAQGFYHRDISLKNILWDKEYNQCGLIDLAKACAYGDDPEVHDDPEGTPDFMAPEVISMSCDGHSCYTEKSEVYALGVIFCHIFSKHPVFFKAFAQIQEFTPDNQNDIPQLLAKAAPDILLTDQHDNPICDLIYNMVRVDKTKRPDLNEIIEKLQSLLNDLNQEPSQETRSTSSNLRCCN